MHSARTSVESPLQCEVRTALHEWRHHPERTSELTEPVDPSHDHVRGDIAAPVAVVEYGSLGSRGESQEDHALRVALEDWLTAGRVSLTFRHFPLVDSQPGVWIAARALEAAGRQGRFWDMHDALTDYLDTPWIREIDRKCVRDVAKRLRLDRVRLEADMERAALATEILRDVQTGIHSGVNGAPTFYVQGLRQDIDGPDELVERIEHALNGDLAALWPPVHFSGPGSPRRRIPLPRR